MTGPAGQRLYWHRWPSSAAVPRRRAVIIVHGFGEHLGRYRHVAAALAGAGYTVWALDLRGHGRSGGPRADVGRLGAVLGSIDQLVDRAAGGKAVPTSTGADDPGARPVLFGHSMGGALAAAYTADHAAKLGGLVLSAPAVHLALRPRWQGAGVSALAAIAPRAGVGRVAPADLSHDEAAVRAFVDDPLVWHGRVPARTATAMYAAGRRAFATASALALPVYVVQGEDDRIVPATSTRRLFELLGSADKELVVLPGCFHEPHQEEAHRQSVIAGLLGWLNRL